MAPTRNPANGPVCGERGVPTWYRSMSIRGQAWRSRMSPTGSTHSPLLQSGATLLKQLVSQANARKSLCLHPTGHTHGISQTISSPRRAHLHPVGFPRSFVTHLLRVTHQYTRRCSLTHLVSLNRTLATVFHSLSRLLVQSLNPRDMLPNKEGIWTQEQTIRCRCRILNRARLIGRTLSLARAHRRT